MLKYILIIKNVCERLFDELVKEWLKNRYSIISRGDASTMRRLPANITWPVVSPGKARFYAPPNFISIPPQRPSSRWTTASHSKPELSLFPHSKILEKKAKALKIVHQVERIDSKTPTGYRSVTKMPSGGAISR